MKLWTGVTSPYGPDLILLLDTSLLPQDIHTLWNPRLLRAVVAVPAGALTVYCLRDVEDLLPEEVEPLYNGWKPWAGDLPDKDLKALHMCEVLHITASAMYVELDTDDGTYYSDLLRKDQWRDQ